MTYITVKATPRMKQMTLKELFSDDVYSSPFDGNITGTRTFKAPLVSSKFLQNIDVIRLVKVLNDFNCKTDFLREYERKNLYNTFYIPKKSGGLRKIDAPNDELMKALRELKDIFERDFGALYHTSAYAYMPHRGIIPALKKHQQNESKWFSKYDLSNFFGSTTLEWLIKMLSQIFPFSEVIRIEKGKAELSKALELAFLDGGLPQGTPISPMLTNIMMIPVDYTISKKLREYDKQTFVYTRYADDFIISSKYNFKFREIEEIIVNTLSQFESPFSLNTKKTRYGSSSGSNWNLGLMINKDNEITVGYKNKKRLEAMLASYVKDRKNGIKWEYGDLKAMEGTINYYKMVEGKTIEKIVAHIGKKLDANIPKMIKLDLKGVEI